jgi:hypothetical protein
MDKKSSSDEFIENHSGGVDESKILGMTKEDGVDYYTSMGYVVSITRVDKAIYFTTCDLRFDRVNFEIDNGTITKVSIG